MSVLILTHSEIERLLPMAECIRVMTDALVTLAQGGVHQPLRMIVQPPTASGLMALMPAYIAEGTPCYGLKIICVFPGNPAKGLDAHQGGVLLFSSEDGRLLAMMNGSAITAIRTAAVSGVATRALAREVASILAIIGSGVQARTHLAAMAAVRPLRQARIASRNFENAHRFCREMAKGVAFPIEAVEKVEDAVRGADLIVTATTASEPVIERGWLAPGAHVNAVGASQPHKRELDTATIKAASLFVDRRESALKEAGDYLIAAREANLGPDHIRAELGEVLIGARPGRRSNDEITCFKSLGLAAEDVAAAEHLYRVAQTQQVGHWVEF
ncbi:MAG TPA: ornithine cyclodeaminase family protein [Myxococcaceae bacterium]|nr:ornithine cyclodeaminase family protein [Myxococcaceae bacterium]